MSNFTAPDTHPTEIPVLMYHDIGTGPNTRSFNRFVVPASLFDEHLAALRDAGYSAGRVSELAESGQVSPGNTRSRTFVTFDDGFSTFMSSALPLLNSYSMTATVYLPSAHVGRTASWLQSSSDRERRLLDWSDARSAMSLGIEIGVHGHRHLELDLLTPSQLQYELAESRQTAEDQLSCNVTSMAYPFGYHNHRVRQCVQLAGYRTACEVGYGLHHQSHDPFRIRRLLIGPDVTAERLLHLVRTGDATVIERARRNTRPLWQGMRRVLSAIRKSDT